jgi:hypothetical protein
VLRFQAAERLLTRGYVEFNNTNLKVTLPPKPDDSLPRKVVVSGIPKVLSTDMLKQFLESPKVNGGSIEEILHETGEDSAVVVFKDKTGESSFNFIELLWHYSYCSFLLNF